MLIIIYIFDETVFFNYYTANSRIYYNILYEQLMFVRITAWLYTASMYISSTTEKMYSEFEYCWLTADKL